MRRGWPGPARWPWVIRLKFEVERSVFNVLPLPMLRSFLPDAQPGATTLELSGSEARHLVSVRRARLGETIEVLNGRGGVWTTRLAASGRDSASLSVETHRRVPAPDRTVSLAFSLLKGDNSELIVEKATELGASRLIPLFTAHGEVRLDPERAAAKAAKWRTQAVESCKQCGNPWLPEIADPLSFNAWIASLSNFPGWKACAALTDQTHPLSKAVSQARSGGLTDTGTLLAIGPEGDFSPAEYAALFQAGFAPVSLGPLVLRAETAAIAGLVLLLDGLR